MKVEIKIKRGQNIKFLRALKNEIRELRKRVKRMEDELSESQDQEVFIARDAIDIYLPIK